MVQMLEGVRVIDLCRGIAGPGSSMYLADQGADVVRIESPGTGRRTIPPRKAPARPSRCSTATNAVSRWT